MSLPEPGVTVTAIVRTGLTDVDDVAAVLGNVVDGRHHPALEPHILWESTTHNFRLALLDEDEGVMWARGGGKEVEGALIAAYRLR